MAIAKVIATIKYIIENILRILPATPIAPVPRTGDHSCDRATHGGDNTIPTFKNNTPSRVGHKPESAWLGH